jgi:cobalt-zinc-cadmium resistance protein CzcA
MLQQIFEFSLRNRLLVLVCAGLLIAVGVKSLGKLPIDAVPDITPNLVQVLAVSPGLGPVDMERFITFPIETAMSGLPGIERIVSLSRFGLALVTLYFKEGMDVYFCRRLVMERLPQARQMIPAGFGEPTMGPIATGLGEIYQFEVRGEGYSSMELRSILDWDIAYKLKSVPGVVEVNSYGGESKTLTLELSAAKLVSYGLAIRQVFNAVEQNNANAGGGYIERAGDQYLVSGEGLITDANALANVIVATRGDGTPIRIRDLGQVRFAPMVRFGATTRDGRGEVVTGLVMMLIGENSRRVAQQVHKKIAEIQRTLPSGVTIDTFYDRTELVSKTIHTVAKNLTEGALLVIAVLLLTLGNVRSGLVVATAIPLSMLFAFTGMILTGLSGNLMSLGAIDFGLIVDGSVVMVENIIRHLAQAARLSGTEGRFGGEAMRDVIREAGREVLKPVFFAVSIIIIVYLPILSLQGVEGKMFRPMALTVVFALFGALLLSFTLMPVLASLLLRRAASEHETFLIRHARRLYTFLLARAVQRPLATAGVAAGPFALSLCVVPFLGTEFIPRLDEGALIVTAWRVPGTSLEESIRGSTLVERLLRRFPKVVSVVTRTGTGEIPNDPMGVEQSDSYVFLTPRRAWKTAKTPDEMMRTFDAVLKRNLPGVIFTYSQPIEMRMHELISGARSDVATVIYGSDLGTLKRLGDEVARVIAEVPGASDIKPQQVAGTWYLQAVVDRDAISRYGINAGDVLDTIQALAGKTVGTFFEDSRRFPIQVRFQPADRSSPEEIGELRVSNHHKGFIPLKQLAKISVKQGPAEISRQNLHRRLIVETNVRGGDLGGFVAAARRAVDEKIKLPPGYWIEWGGQFENLKRAEDRLKLMVPLALFLIFMLLYSTYGAAKPALLIYLNVPLAATGGIFALALRGMPFSVSAGVGFIALFGVAVLNGVVLMSYVLQMRQSGVEPLDAARGGAEIRFRPVLTTALVAGLGFLPMAISTSAGAEVQRPLATVVIGGLLTSTALTLLVLPALYAWLESPSVSTWLGRRLKN